MKRKKKINRLETVSVILVEGEFFKQFKQLTIEKL